MTYFIIIKRTVAEAKYHVSRTDFPSSSSHSRSDMFEAGFEQFTFSAKDSQDTTRLRMVLWKNHLSRMFPLEGATFRVTQIERGRTKFFFNWPSPQYHREGPREPRDEYFGLSSANLPNNTMKWIGRHWEKRETR